MVEMEKVCICDNCKEMISKFKCDFCGKDMCEDCQEEGNLEISGTILTNFNFCNNCENAIEGLEYKENAEMPIELKNNIKDYIKNIMTLEALKEKPEKADHGKVANTANAFIPTVIGGRRLGKSWVDQLSKQPIRQLSGLNKISPAEAKKISRGFFVKQKR